MQRLPRLPVCLVATLGCTSTIESKTPSLLAASPGLVCGTQLETDVWVTGAGLAPVPTGTATDQSALVLPDLWLEQASSLSGEPAASTSRIRLPDPQWESMSEMRVSITPDLDVTAGIYDLFVEVADGQNTRLPSALSVLDAPVLTDRVPGLICLDQSARTLTLEGSGLLVAEDAYPAVHIESTILEATAVHDCTGIPAPVDAELCQSIEVELPQGSLGPDIHELSVVNPGVAACTTPEPLQFEVVAAPSLEDTTPALACGDGQEEGLALLRVGSPG